MTKNIGKSIRMRLLNLAKEEKLDYMKVLVRYLHERLLFRISASPFKSHFLLKGSSLLFALDGFKARPTIDIDLLGERISNDRESLKVVFQKVCSVECEDDTRNMWWRAFLKKIRWKEPINFSDVMNCIRENLQVYWNEEILGR